MIGCNPANVKFRVSTTAQFISRSLDILMLRQQGLSYLGPIFNQSRESYRAKKLFYLLPLHDCRGSDFTENSLRCSISGRTCSTELCGMVPFVRSRLFLRFGCFTFLKG